MVPLDRDALVVAMALVPRLFSRNKMFALFKNPELNRARARAAQLRGVVRQLAGAHGDAEVLEFARHNGAAHEPGQAGRPAVLCFKIRPIHFVRRLELTEVEAACVVYLCGRSGVACLHPAPNDRPLLDGALRRLFGGLHLAALEASPETGDVRQPS